MKIFGVAVFTIMPDITVWTVSVPAAFFLLLILGSAGLPFMALTGQAMAVAKRRSFYDKCGRQMATLTAILAPLALLMLGLAVGRSVQMDPTLLESPLFLPIIALGSLILSSAVFAVLYACTWTRLKELRAVHQIFGLAAGLGMMKALYVALAVARAMFVSGHPLPATGTPVEIMRAVLLPASPSLMLPCLATALCAGVAVTGLFAMIWLILRRNADDFGRDYYNFTMSWCASWATCGYAVCIAPLAYLMWLVLSPLFLSIGATFQTAIAVIPLVPLGCIIVTPILGLICSGMVSLNPSPMRFKPFVWFVFLLQFFASASVIALLLTFARNMA